jgi:hypothetical protein
MGANPIYRTDWLELSSFHRLWRLVGLPDLNDILYYFYPHLCC